MGPTRGKVSVLDRIALCVFVFCVFAATVPSSPSAQFPVAIIHQEPAQSAQGARQMEEMARQQRLCEQREAKAQAERAGSLATAEEASAGLDYMVLMLLASSGLVVFIVSRRRRRPRRARRLPPPFLPSR